MQSGYDLWLGFWSSIETVKLFVSTLKTLISLFYLFMTFCLSTRNFFFTWFLFGGDHTTRHFFFNMGNKRYQCNIFVVWISMNKANFILLFPWETILGNLPERCCCYYYYCFLYLQITLNCTAPMQVDGEPWLQQPVEMSVTHRSKATMLSLS